MVAQEVDGSDIRREWRDKQTRIAKLTVEDQLRLRAAEEKAAADPEVKAALERREKAMAEFRATLRASMIKADPGVAPLLQQVATGVDRGY